jgi:hypothetical protein
MPDPAPPRIHSPRDGAAVDGLACTLSWDPVPGATYRVQVSANERFDALLVDADAENATVLTLYELLPRDGRRLHWRVAATRSGSDGAWSEPTWFLSADMEDRPPAPRATRTTAKPASRSTHPPMVAAEAEPVPPYLEETTGAREVLIAFAVLLLTVFLFLLAAF